MEEKKAQKAAKLLLGGLRAIVHLVPAPVRKNLEDRLFYVIFQKTRVENDAYGWRPPMDDKKEKAPKGAASKQAPE